MEVTPQYLAGLFDGEGTFSVTRTQRRYLVPTVFLCNTDERLIRILEDRWGTTRGIRKSKPRKPNHKIVYRWEMNSGRAGVICEELGPYLVSKKEQAHIVKLVADTNSVRRGGGNGKGNPIPPILHLFRDFAEKRIRQLNKRGV